MSFWNPSSVLWLVSGSQRWKRPKNANGMCHTHTRYGTVPMTQTHCQCDTGVLYQCHTNTHTHTLVCSRGILILMKVGISTSTWFQVVPYCSLISEHFFSALGWFFTPSVIFYDLKGNLHWDDLKWPKKHFWVAKRWFWGVECTFWRHISIEKCFRFSIRAPEVPF